VRRYARTGVDGVFVTGLRQLREVEAVREAAGGLPQLLYAIGPEISAGAGLSPLGVRLLIEGHKPALAAVHAAYDALAGQIGVAPDPVGLLERLTRSDAYARDTLRFLEPEGSDHGD